ncbi:MAG: DNA repair protein RecN, partial [Eubacteriales bacterium]
MLTSLHIENIAVIKSVDIEFGDNFTVLTGETGAGKSIIIDSLGLILGIKPSKELIRSGEESALVSAIFSDISRKNLESVASVGINADEDGVIYIQRTVYSDGRSQAKINGRSVPASILRETAKFLLNIHGQHANQALLDPKRHIDFLDEYADDGAQLAAYREKYKILCDIDRRISEVSRDDKEKARMAELLKYQIQDIAVGRLKDGEEENLLAEKKKIQNVEKILKQSRMIYRALYRSEKGASAYALLEYAAGALEAISDVLPDAKANADKLRSYMYELEDIAVSVHDASEVDYDDPTAELNRIESRLDIIDKLKKKYGASAAEVLAFKEKAEKELSDLELSDIILSELEKEREGALSEAVIAAEELSMARRRAAKGLENRVTDELVFLEMPKVSFSVVFKNNSCSEGCVRYTSAGADNVEFQISTNVGEPQKPLDKIASGGELSRIMLALKSVFAEKDEMETIVFDEVDTGVSGKTSQKIGIKLAQLSKSTQVLCVTHSAQIAALGSTHLFIYKNEE